MPIKTKREQQRKTMEQTIKDTARQQMAETGTSGLSLRGIAKEMDITAPAIYRYFPSRDDLITALIVDAFNALADALEDADQEQAPTDYAGRLMGVLARYRAWALQHPIDFQLIYGNPIPGYQAPREVTVPAVIRSMTVIGRILAQAQHDGKLHPRPEHIHLPPTLAEHMRQYLREDIPMSLEAFYALHVGWTRIHGMIVLELFEHTPATLGDTETFYRREVESLLRDLGMMNAI